MSHMFPDMESYFRQFVPPRDPLLEQLEEEADKENIPIVGPVVGELLFILARITGARNILELGTATGYSSIFLARACNDINGKVVTFERDPLMIQRAQANIKHAGLEQRVDFKIGDVLDEIKHVQTIFDMIFIDVEKRDYAAMFEACRHLLKRNGLLVADNTGFKDADSFNRSIFEAPDFRVAQILSYLPFHSPEKDGLCIAVKL